MRAILVLLFSAFPLIAAAPTATYRTLDTVYTQGVAIRPDTPAVTGAPNHFTITPALPAGLAFNTANGTISGTPQTTYSATYHTVTVANFLDSGAVTLRIGVVAPPLPVVHYTPAAKYYPLVPMSLTPVVTGPVSSYSVEPALPSALSLNTATGVISGTPYTYQSLTHYIITAFNAAGSSRDTVTFEVAPAAWATVLRPLESGGYFANTNFLGLCVFDDTHATWVGGQNSFPSSGGPNSGRTTDGGSTWTTVPGNTVPYLRFTGCHVNPQGIGFATGKTTQGAPSGRPFLWKTADTGKTWTQALIPNIFINMQFPDSNIGYAQAGDTLLKSVTGGGSWGAIATGVPEKALRFLSTSVGYAAGTNGRLAKTTNGGSTWTNLVSGTTKTFTALYLSGPDTVYAVGDSGILVKSTNAGTSWTVLSTGTLAVLTDVGFINHRTGYIAGLKGALLGTIDGGATWSAQEHGGQTHDFETITTLKTGVAYVMSYSGVIMKCTDVCKVAAGIPSSIVPAHANPRAGLETSLREHRTLRFTLTQRSPVRVRLYDLRGTLLAEPLKEVRDVGAYSLPLPTESFKGTYVLLEFMVGSQRQTLHLTP